MNDARESLALWLRSGRANKKLSLEDVAKITKIQPRILEKLERGELDGLPAEVFVKGFVRSFAKCVGLDEQEAIVRYGACKSGEAASTPVAKALVESMGLARKPQGTPPQPTPVVAAPVEPVIETPAIEVAPIVEPVVEEPALVAEILAEPIVEIAAAPVVEPTPSEQPKKKRSRKKNPTNGAPRSRKKKGALSIEVNLAPAIAVPATNEIAPPAEGIGLATTDVDDEAHTTQIVTISLDTGPVAKVDGESLFTSAIEAKTDDCNSTSDGAVEQPRLAEGSQRISSSQIEVVDASAIDSTATEIVASEPEMSAVSGTWQPTMPPIASTPSVPWRRPSITASRAYVVPTLVIDDADPDSADREREDRAEKDHSRLSFLPPILLDREDRSSRQGGLTLAVIILLIAATLTLSYLMRRPSASGDGVTMLDGTSQLYS
jgi:cytoskeletal protein RodZ